MGMFFLCDEEETLAYHNMAVERCLVDYCQRLIDEGEEDIWGLYLWQNEKTIVIGRNQCAKNEYDPEKVIEKNVTIARRMTGGGAVYHDLGNLNFSFYTNKRRGKTDNYNLLVEAFKALGIRVSISGRNDILVDEKKISGNAFMINGDVELHHGTVLVSSDLEVVQQVLTPNLSKLKKNGIQSVSSRVININTIIPDVSIENVKDSIREEFYLANKDRIEVYPYINHEDVDKWIDHFSDKKWIFDKARKHDYSVVEDWGYIDFSIIKDGNVIERIEYETDVLDVGLLEKSIRELYGLELSTDSINRYKEFNYRIDDSESLMIRCIVEAIEKGLT